MQKNPDSPPEGPIKNLPNELLNSIFQFGVDSQYEELEETNRDDELEWKGSVDEDDKGRRDTAVGPTEGTENSDDPGDFQVVVSHVCRRWRSLALSTPNLWTILSFSENPSIEKAKEYIMRSESHPLTINFESSFSASVDDPSQEHHESRVSRILDLIEPEVPRWRAFTYRHTPNGDLRFLMSRLHEMPEAKLLESFRILYSFGYKPQLFSTYRYQMYPCLPFHGRVPNLKEAAFWGAQIDWDNALPGFLRRLRKLELTSLVDSLRPSYATFVQMIKNSPELHTLALSFAGPHFPYSGDSHDTSDSDFLTIPSLRNLLLQSYHPPYATALVQRLNLPNLHTLGLNFLADCSSFLQTVSTPRHGQTQSLLQSITCLTIFRLPCETVSSVELLLEQLVSLKTLKIESLILLGNTTIFRKLEPSNSSDEIFCPKLEELVVSGCNGENLTAIINARRNAGVPLKKVVIKKSAKSVQGRRWIEQGLR